MKFSQRTPKDFLKSQAVSRRRRQKKVLRLYLLGGAVALLLIALIMLLRLDRIQIRNVVVTGNVSLSESEIEEQITKILDSNYFFVIPKRNSFIYPKDHIAEAVKKRFLRVGEISMNVESFEYLNVKIKEREPIAKWCNPIDCYLVDDNGYAFSKFDESTSVTNAVLGTQSELLMITGMDEIIGTEPVGKEIFSKEMITKFFEIKTVLESFELMPKELEYRSKDEIIFKTSGSGKIILNERRPFEESMNNLKAVLDSDVFEGKMSSLDYIDTRFGNKVFYKFKNQEAVDSSEKPVSSTSSTATSTSRTSADRATTSARSANGSSSITVETEPTD